MAAVEAMLIEKKEKLRVLLMYQLFNSSEKRLASALLILARYGKEGEPEALVATISQETMAGLVETTRRRVNFSLTNLGSSDLVITMAGCKFTVLC
jgi:CRP/FNR family transcriptional regulator, cyclic AMP receptor protein